MSQQQQRQKASVKAFIESKDEDGRVGYLHLPEGVKLFKLERTGRTAYRIEHVPYIVGKGNPAADEGMEHFERTFYIHKNLGPDGNSSAICNMSTFRKRCKFCEYRDQLRRDGVSWKDTANLNPRKRILFRVYDRDNTELAQGDNFIQVWETGDTMSYGEVLKNKIGAVEEYANFADLDGGRTLILTVSEGKFNGKAFNKVTNIEMVERKKPLPAEWLEEGPNLDELIKPISDRDAMRLLSPGGDDEEPEDDAPAPKPGKPAAKSKPVDDDDDLPPAKPKKPKPAEDDDDDIPAPKAKKASRPVDDEEDAPPPPRANKPKAPPPPDDEDDDIPVKPKGKSPPPPTDDDEDDDMPPPPRGRR